MPGFTVSGRTKQILQYVLYFVAFGMLFYQLYITQAFVWEPQRNRILHLGMALIVLLLGTTIKKGNWLLNGLLLLVTLGITIYFIGAYRELARYTHILPLGAMVSGILAVVLIVVTGWRAYGATFPVLVFIALLYITLGQYLPYPVKSPSIPIERLIGWMAADVTLEWGAYGDILGLSASYLFLFIIFGSVLQSFGAMKFIRGLGELVATRLRSGPAAMSIVASSLVGTVTGSTVANVTIVGSFTIPLMKSAGYTPESAAAIESAASNGGQIMPPVMGIVAFVMASFIGVPYAEVALRSIIPALLYYFCLLLYAQFQARKLGIQRSKTKVSGKQILIDAPSFVLPLGLLIYLMYSGFSLMFTIFWTLIATMSIGLTTTYLMRERLNWRLIRNQMMGGIQSACEVAVICSLTGVAVAAIELTGLGITLGILLNDMAGGNVFVLYVFTMVVATILGMPLPTVATYVLTAAVLSPTLIQAGVPVLIAHYFPFWYAVFGNLTPPIGIGPIVASKMANSKYWPTMNQAMMAAGVTYLLPFYIAYAPAILLMFNQGPVVAAIQFVSALVAIIALSMALNRESFTTLRLPEWIMMWLTAIVITFYLIAMPQNYYVFIAGVLLFIVSGGLNYLHRKEGEPALA